MDKPKSVGHPVNAGAFRSVFAIVQGEGSVHKRVGKPRTQQPQINVTGIVLDQYSVPSQ
jgi:hypothetical protein